MKPDSALARKSVGPTRVTLRSVAMHPAETEEALESGTADLAVGYYPDLAKPGFFQQRFFRNTFVCIVRAEHPLVGERGPEMVWPYRFPVAR